MALCLGADAVWVGTRFVAAEEAGAPPAHQKAVLRAGPHDTIRSTIYTGRPMRIIKNTYVVDAEENHAEEIKEFAICTSSMFRKMAASCWRLQQEQSLLFLIHFDPQPPKSQKCKFVTTLPVQK